MSELTQFAIFTGESSGDQFGYANTYFPLAVADVNEDGIDDVLVGARYHTPSGGLYIFFGGQNITSKGALSADIILRDDEDTEVGDSGFGETFSTGDIDGDGHLELLVGNYRHDTDDHNEGAAYIFKLGSNFSSRGVSQAEARTVGLLYRQSLSSPAKIIGDFNGDGFDDYVLTGLVNDFNFHIYYGSGTLTNKTIEEDNVTISDPTMSCLSRYIVPNSVDINNDGYSDLVIGCAYANSVSGVVKIFYGGSNVTDKTINDNDLSITPTGSIDFLGGSVDTGFINSDEYPDIIVSSSSKVYIFLGENNQTNLNTDNADYVISADPANTSCPNLSFSAFSDVNNDNIEDIVLTNSCLGKIYVFYSSSLSSTSTANADLIYQGPANLGFGDPLEFGDLNNDGYTDIVSSLGEYNNRQGQVYLLSVPHGDPTITIDSINYDSSNPFVNGSVSDSLYNGGVEFSLDNSIWSSCSSSDGSFDEQNENFICRLPQSSPDSSHTLRLRYKNIHGIYIPETSYVTRSIRYLSNASPSYCRDLKPIVKALITGIQEIHGGKSALINFTTDRNDYTELVIEYGEDKSYLRYSVAGIPKSSTNYTINLLNPNSSYNYRIRVSNGCAVGDWSEIKNEIDFNKSNYTIPNQLGISSSSEFTPINTPVAEKASLDFKTLNEDDNLDITPEKTTITSYLKNILNLILSIFRR